MSDVLARVDALAHDLWWMWNPEAQALFASMDPTAWRAKRRNPLAVLADLHPSRREVLLGDERFAARVAEVEHLREQYFSTTSWFEESGRDQDLHVAYFCMEYGLHESLPLYAGGLGVLAGDHLKSASDLGIPLTAVGILWRKGYYRQEIELDGAVRVLYPQLDLGLSPIQHTGEHIWVTIGEEHVRADVWRLQVGRVTLYLLDTDVDGNSHGARALSWHLYGGDHDYRVRQEVLLGVGGTHLLHHFDVRPTVWHLNEGHAAFAGIERIRRFMREEGLDYDESVERVKASSVFTTHTPVPQGNDRFHPDLVWHYLGRHAGIIGRDRDEFLALGRVRPDDPTETFCMTVLALKLSDGANGVAELHGQTAREMWYEVWGLDDPADAPIGHVTNGVHPQTWIAPQAQAFYRDRLKATVAGAGPDDDPWSAVDEVPAAELWALRSTLRAELVTEMRTLLAEQILRHGGGEEELRDLYETFDESALTIGFARRFATYKRAPLVFRDVERLEAIVGDSDRPVQLVFAGKAHPNDGAGHDFVRRVWEFSRRPALRGRVWLLENYDLAIGRLLTRGTDVWLNNPVRPMEASGTSGMKGPLNGGINCSILDGWWAEGYTGDNGWSLGGDQGLPGEEQDAADALAIYETLEEQVVPLFYDRDADGIPTGWVEMMRRSMRTTFPRFSTHRMLADYLEQYYRPANNG